MREFLHNAFFEQEVISLLKTILQKENSIMSSIDDLNAAVSDITVSIANEIQALQNAQASNNDVAIEQAVSNLKTLNTQLQASVTPVVSTPAPAPVQ